MGSRIMNVYYGNDFLPYKDKERQVHYPITGNSLAGSSNVQKIRFFTKDIGGVIGITWVAITKLPNGRKIYQVLSTVGAENGENYVELSLSSYYTQLQGDIYISLNGCDGEVEITTDQETGVQTIEAILEQQTVVATGVIKVPINYAVQRPQGFSFNIDQYQDIMNAMKDKANVFNTIQVVQDLLSDPSEYFNYEIGQIFYDLATETYWELKDLGDNLDVEEIRIDKNKYVWRQNLGAGNQTLSSLYTLFGKRVFVGVINNREYICQLQSSASGTNCLLLDFATQNYYYGSGDLTPIKNVLLNTPYKYRVQITNAYKLYATDSSGNDIELAYDVNITANAVPVRNARGDLLVPLQPGYNNSATSKKYVDDLIATLKESELQVVSELPESGEQGVIYLVPINQSDLTQGYYRYIWEDNAWLSLGTTEIDLSDYYTQAQVDTLLGGKVDKTTSVNKLYGTNALGQQVALSYGENANEYTIVLRTANGDIIVPTTPSGNSHATSKQYVDTQDNLRVAKTNIANKVYITGDTGEQDVAGYDDYASGVFVRRNDSGGQIYVPQTPTANTHATSKKYVDDSIANAIANVYKIKGSKTVAELNALTSGELHVGDVYNLLDNGTLNAGNIDVFTGDNVVWLGSAWDKLGTEIDWSAYDEKFISAGFFEVQNYNESTGEITLVYATDLYVMSYDGDTGIMTIEAN